MSKSVGTPTWIDVSSTDLAASKAFYEQFFGWTFEDTGEEMGHYQMIRKDGTLVGGGMDVTGMTCPDGQPLPSEWGVYLAVDDVEARTRKATENGAKMVVQPGDAGAAGRFSVVLDPTGAAVGLWQPGDTEGYEFSGAPGTPAWFELMAQDFDAATKFYTEVFDFNLVAMQTAMDDAESPFRYSTNGPEAEATSGICDDKGFIPEDSGSFWRVYFIVEGCDAAAQRAQELGGKLIDGPMDSPFGRIATIADPAGASFQICSPSEAVAESQNS